MSENLDSIRARAKAYNDHGTPGLHAPQDRDRLLYALESVLAYGRDRKKYTDTGNEQADILIIGYAGHIERLIDQAMESTR